MRRFISIFFAASFAVSAATAYADPPGRVARLAYASGAVSFAPGEDQEAWSRGVVNRPLTSGDRLWTERDGYAEAQVGSTALRLAPLTNVDVTYLDDDRMQLRLPQGSMNMRVRVLDPEEAIEVTTPNGAVVIREPGSYRINVDPNTQMTRVAVNDGRAEAMVNGRRLPIPEGQSLALSGQAPGGFERATPDEFDRWSSERDRRSDRSVSTRYVSPHMTGHEELDRHGTWSNVPEYGPVWRPTQVAADWAPYRHGHWEWISPWGWTWIDDAPWGFAPSHYGRWVRVHDHWGWAPGRVVRRPVYAPALVAFVGGSNWSVSLSSGPAVGWFPLGYHEPYRPWYRTSPRYVQNVNVTHVTNVTNITNITHVHRNRPDAVTVVSRDNFVSARPAGRNRVRVAQADLARAEVIRDRAPVERAAGREAIRRAEREGGATSPDERAAVRAQTEQRVRAEQREQSAGRAGRGPREPEERADGSEVKPGQAGTQSAMAEQRRTEQREQAGRQRAEQRQQATQREQTERQRTEQRQQGERQRTEQRQQAAQREQTERQRAEQRQQAAQREQADAGRRAAARTEAQRQATPRAEPPRERPQRGAEASAQRPASAQSEAEVRRRPRAERDG